MEWFISLDLPEMARPTVVGAEIGTSVFDSVVCAFFTK